MAAGTAWGRGKAPRTSEPGQAVLARKFRILLGPPLGRLVTLLGLLVGLLVALPGCGDPPLSQTDATGTGDSTGFDLGGTFDAAAGKDLTTADDAAGAQDAVTDAQVTDATSTDDAAQADGAQPADVAADVPAPKDTPAPMDVPVVELQLTSFTPADGTIDVAQPLKIELKFNQELKPEALSAQTVLITSHGGDSVPGKFTVSGDSVTFAANAGAVGPSSRVDVEVTTLVTAKKGPNLQQPVTFRFYTAPLPGLEPYAQLAARYAPTLRQAIATKDDYLRALDFDGNWDVGDNPQKAPLYEPEAEVVWSVIETQSHYYLSYQFYWAHRPAVPPGVAFDNDVAGSVVVVAKYPSEKPIALMTYFKAKTDEQMWAWATTESGLPTGGNKFWRTAVPEAQLFPPATDTLGCEGKPGCVPKRYPGFLTAGSHQSCLWLDAGESFDKQCVLSAQVKAGLKWIDYLPAAKAQAATEPPANPGPSVGYALRPLLGSWWLHRDEAGEGKPFVDTQFTYVPPPDRPGSGLKPWGSKFRSTLDADFGRPGWAWKWKPGTLSASYYDLPRGTPWLDPAYTLVMRLGGAGKAPAWDAQKKTGLSLAYCLHPFFGLDLRDKPECQPGP